MLGREIADPEGIESTPVSVSGLGHLNIVTAMMPHKRLALTQATYLETGDVIEGYEIHLGKTTGPDCKRAWLSVNGRKEGASSPSGRIMGCYLHGLFASDSFRAAFLNRFGVQSDLNYAAGVDTTLNELATHLENHLDLECLLSLAEKPQYQSSY